MIDSHCHINTSRFDDDRDAVIARAREAGVGEMVIIGAAGSLDLCRSAIAMAEADAGIWATVGIHPHDASACDRDVLDAIEAMAPHPKVVAIGETGLDYYYDTSPKADQLDAFHAFIGMAKRHRKPLVLHIRDAHDEAMAVIEESGATEVGGVVHCFTGTYDEGQRWLDLGFHLGITGIVTFKRAGDLPRVVADAPLERLLIETDSPYLAPTPLRGKRNEPAYVAHVAAKVAELRSMSLEDVDAATTENTRKLFGMSATG